MNNPNQPNINQENSSQHNNTGNMYSYKDDNDINNPNELEAGAIRRSLGEGNPNAFFHQPSYNQAQFEQNNINEDNGKIMQYQINDNKLNHPFIKLIPFIIFGCIEIIIIILIATLFKWDIRNDPENFYLDALNFNEGANSAEKNISQIIKKEIELELNTYDGLFKDINIMVFVGFGMLHTLLKKYSWTSISINMMAIAFSFQIGLFSNLLWKNAFKEKWKTGILNFESFIKSIINSCTVLVSLGCILGKLSTIQYMIMVVIETIICSLNFQICEAKLEIIDVGGALYIHTFGAIFGLAVYMVLFFSKKMKSTINEFNSFNNSNYFSNITSFIGVIFLWCYFPSFNTGLAPNDNSRYRSSMNTYFSLTGSTVGAFIASGLFNKGRINFEHILFGCYSGGVIISGCCYVCIDHWAALLIGFLCGLICVSFISLLKPYFVKWGFHDIYNIIGIHGIPGLLGAFITPMMIGDIKRRVNEEHYHYILLNDMERENDSQAGFQVGAIFITLGLSFVSGIATGYLMKVSKCGTIRYLFTDSEIFENEENIIDNLEQNQFYYGQVNRASLFQNQMEFAEQIPRLSEARGSQPSYN